MKYKAVFFDIDDTICISKETKSLVYERLYELIPRLKNVSRDKFLSAVRKHKDEYFRKIKTRGFNTFARADIWLETSKDLDLDLSVGEIKNLIDNYWKYSVDLIKLYPGACEILEYLKNKELIIAALTGGDFYSKSMKLIRLGVEDHFDYIFSTDMVQKDKVSGDIYKYALSFLKLEAKEVIMIGDKVGQDIEPAKRLGIDTIQALMRGDQPVYKEGIKKPDFTINKLSEIKEIIK